MTVDEIQRQLARWAVEIDNIRGGLLKMREDLSEFSAGDVDQIGPYLHGLVGIMAEEEAEPLRDSLKGAARITQADLDAEMPGTDDGTDSS